MHARTTKKPPKPSSASVHGAEGGRAAAHGAPTQGGGLLAAGRPVFRLGLPVQAKVVVGEVGDPFEREADAVADRVAAGQASPPVSRLPAGGLGPTAQRQAEEAEEPVQTVQRQMEEEAEEPVQALPVQRAAEGEEEATVQMTAVQRQAVAEEEEPVQARDGGAGPAGVTPAMRAGAARAIQQKGPGSPLQAGTRRALESRIGADLTDVRVHEDGTAREAAAALKARAFTHRNHIWLGPGASQGDVRLMAHEATHVLQQDGVVRRQPLEPEEEQPLAPEAAAVEARAAGAAPAPPAPSETAEEETAALERSEAAGPAPAMPEAGASVAETPAEAAEQTASEAAEALGAVPVPEETEEAVAAGKEEGAGLEAAEAVEEPGAEGAAGEPAAEGAEEAAAEEETGEAAPEEEAAGKGAEGVPGEEAAPAGEEGEGAAGDRAPSSPEEDPAFQAVLKKTKAAAGQQAHADPAPKKAGEAQAAAAGPPNEVASQAAGAQVAKMGAQEPQPFDRAAFKAALLEKIAAIAPKSLKEADDFKKNNQAASIKGAVTSQVEAGKEKAQGPIKETTGEALDPSVARPKEVTPLPPVDPGPPPPDLGAERAAPKPKTPSEVSLQEGSRSLDQQMAEADVTEEQLEQSNEPEFQQALGAKKEAQVHAEEAPVAYRQDEQAILAGAEAQAAASAEAQTEAMHGTRQEQLGQVAGAQETTKSEDEQKRAEVAGHIEEIYRNTRQKVEARLSKLDEEVNTLFDRGAEQARQTFEAYVERRMDAYKDRRYSGLRGKARWVKDKFLGLPSEVNVFYQEGRDLYIREMDAVIDRVAAAVETGLTEAQALVDTGLQEVQDYVNSLPEDLRQVGQAAAEKIQAEFDTLRQSVNEKRDQLVDALAQKYADNLQKVDARIEEMKAANRGLVDKAFDAVAGVIKTILKLKDMLLGVLARAASVIGKIIRDPIGFLGNLVSGVKLGLQNFMGRIGTHLKQGLMAWLFGAMAEAGIQLPERFDLKGIIGLVLQVLGLTYANIRARAVNILGEQVVARLEQVAEIFKILVTEGPAGLWVYIKERVGDVKSMILDEVMVFVRDKIIIAGITWIIGLLNPASAFIKAAKAIYDIIMFIVTRGSQIVALVNAVLDSVAAIASGAIAGAAAAVENALAKAIPVAIGFLASLLGLGGISEKIRSVIQKIQAPVNKAIDWVIQKAVKLVQAVGGLFGGGKKKKEDKEGETGDPEHDLKLRAGLADIDKEEQRYAEKGKITRKEAEQVAGTVKKRHPMFKSITIIDGGDSWNYAYKASDGVHDTPTAKEEAEAGDLAYKVGDLVVVKHISGWEAATVNEVQDKELVWFKLVSGKQAGSRYGLPYLRVAEGKADVKPLDAAAKGNGPYSYLPDPPGVGPFKHFTGEQKATIIAENRKKNGGALRSDASPTDLVLASPRAKGVPVNPNEVNIDHIFPRSKGGFNSYANAQVLSFSENLRKLDKVLAGP